MKTVKQIENQIKKLEALKLIAGQDDNRERYYSIQAEINTLDWVLGRNPPKR